MTEGDSSVGGFSQSSSIVKVAFRKSKLYDLSLPTVYIGDGRT